jgi:hypothetical protein
MATARNRLEYADTVMENETDDLTDEQVEKLRKRLHDRAINELNFSEEDAKLFSDVFAEAARTERSEGSR